MEHDLAPKIFQLFVANLANSPTIDCDSRLDLKNFRHNLTTPDTSEAPKHIFTLFELSL